MKNVPTEKTISHDLWYLINLKDEKVSNEVRDKLIALSRPKQDRRAADTYRAERAGWTMGGVVHDIMQSADSKTKKATAALLRNYAERIREAQRSPFDRMRRKLSYTRNGALAAKLAKKNVAEALSGSKLYNYVTEDWGRDEWEQLCEAIDSRYRAVDDWLLKMSKQAPDAYGKEHYGLDLDDAQGFRASIQQEAATLVAFTLGRRLK